MNKIFEFSFTFFKIYFNGAEVNVIRLTACCRALNASLYFTLMKLVVFLTLLAYILTGNNNLSPDKVIDHQFNEIL